MSIEIRFDEIETFRAELIAEHLDGAITRCLAPLSRAMYIEVLEDLTSRFETAVVAAQEDEAGESS